MRPGRPPGAALVKRKSEVWWEEEKKVMDTKIDTIVKLEPYINDIIKRIQYLEQKEDREPPRDVLFIIVLMLMLFLNFIKVFGVRYI